jgi:hypothetical protein
LTHLMKWSKAALRRWKGLTGLFRVGVTI